jgi:hypothetical protein
MPPKKVKADHLTESLTKREVAVLAVFLLGGDKRSIDTEDVAVKASELAPKAFAWRKYPDQINLELVRAVLSDAKKAHFGALLHGTGTTGWRLSDAGVAWAHRQREKVDGGVGEAFAPWAGSSDARRSDRELQRMRASEAWSQWKSTGVIEVEPAKQLFRIDDYATAEMKDIKVARLRSAAVGDHEAAAFIDEAAKRVLQG